MLEFWTCAQFVPSHDISITTVAVPALVVACRTRAGAARATITSVVGPVAVSGVPVNVPLAHDLVAAWAAVATRRTSGTRNLALPLRSFESVCASAACRFVRVDACDPSFKTERANAPVDFPAAFALAVNAPGLFIAPWIHLSFAMLHLGSRGRRRKRSAMFAVLPTRPWPSGAGGRMPSSVFALSRAPEWGLKSGVPGTCGGVGPIRRPRVLIP